VHRPHGQSDGTLPGWLSIRKILEQDSCGASFQNLCEHYSLSLQKKFIFILQRNIRFTEWFQFEPLTNYHKVVLAEDFMEYLAPMHWPPEKRIGFCWQPVNSKEKKCNMKEGDHHFLAAKFCLMPCSRKPIWAILGWTQR
jgi:hypothetical protein